MYAIGVTQTSIARLIITVKDAHSQEEAVDKVRQFIKSNLDVLTFTKDSVEYEFDILETDLEDDEED